MTLLESIGGPQDLKAPSGPDLVELADDIRKCLVQAVAGTRGRLGPGLGVVELSITLHRVFGTGRISAALAGRKVRAERDAHREGGA